MADYTPIWLNLLLGIGLLAASMSTVDTCANVVALSFSYDLVEPAVRNRWSPEQKARMARISSVGAIGLAFVYALFTESLWDVFYLSSGLLTTTVFLPVIGTFFKRTSRRQVYASLVVGFLATVLFYYLESRSLLQAIEPQWMEGTGIGYILYAFIAAAMAFGVTALKIKS